MPAYGYVIVFGGWVIWVLPLLLRKRYSPTVEKRDSRARWGVLMQAAAYTLVWQTRFWSRPIETWRIFVSITFFILGPLFVYGGVKALGKQWRIDAGVNADHQLVRHGAYSIVRHPIYTSMLCLLLGTGFLITPLWQLAIAVVLVVIGTEIRVRVEEGLLKERFGEEFAEYRRSVPAYVPFLKLRRGTKVLAKT